MASRTLPGLGLKGDWDLGETGWKDDHDLNLLKMSVLLGGQALDLVSADPGSPSEGDIYLLDETHATHPNKIAVYDEAAWVYFAVPVGVIVWDVAAAIHRTFNGTVWAAL